MKPILCALLAATCLTLATAQTDGPVSREAETDRSLMPKVETGALEFLKKYPEYDGRGTVVAIFDTGVDPAAAGLQKTSDGRPKIVDLVDGTGSGDVQTSTVRKLDDGLLEGLSGRELKVGSDWKNPTGEYHVGIKPAYQLFPPELVTRRKQERRKEWNKKHAATEAALRQNIATWDSDHPSPSERQKLEKSDLQVRLEQLRELAKSYDDPGPVYDCVVFHDGERWNAVIDTDEDADLGDEKVMTNFRAEQQYATFSAESQLNFAVNIYDEGNLLSIVADGHPHGTHVAGIVAGYYPDQPELNGVAPGAQIVSIKIGDNRLDGMETSEAFERALSAVLENECDLINMSFGEPTKLPDRGYLPELFSRIVNENDVIFVSSAGNSGPALSTVGAPGGTTTAVLGVGAYISPAMMESEYAMREQLEELPYTWTSRGPTMDGDMGVDIFAPGGAIAPVPNWTLQRNMRMNGTSMASPNACGNIALMLSAMKAQNKLYSPHSVRRAIQNTARPIEGHDVFAQGPGLLQIMPAYDYLLENAESNGEQLRYDVRVLSLHNARGIYLREPSETSHPVDLSINVRPVFPEDADNRDKVDYEMHVALEATEDWVQTGSGFVLTHGGLMFSVRVDPTRLAPGVHFAEILGHDSTTKNRGPIFRIPVTVIRTVPSASQAGVAIEERLSLQPGQVERRFLAVPEECTWADVSLKLETEGNSRVIVMHTVQASPGESFEDGERNEFIPMQPGVEVVRSLPVTAGRTLELCLSQYWSSLGPSQLSFKVNYRSLVPNKRDVTIGPGEAGTLVELHSNYEKVSVSPSAKLTTLRKTLRPASAKIEPLSADRNTQFTGRQIYRLLLTYRFKQDAKGSVTPRLLSKDDLLYDSTAGAHLWMLYDSNKRLITTDDIWPDAVSLEKGDYTLRVQIRNTDVELLDSLKSVLLSLDHSLSSPISASIYPTRMAADSGGGKFTGTTLEPSESLSLWIAAPTKGQLPAGASAGDILLGTISYGDEDAVTPGEGKRPGGYPFRYVVPSSSTGTGAGSTASKIDPKELENSIRDFMVEQLKKFPTDKQDEAFEKLANELLEVSPNHLPVLVARLHRLDDEERRKEQLDKVVAAADAVIDQIDTDKLAVHFGRNVNEDDPVAKKAHAEMQKQRETLVDALYRKGRALGYMELPEVIRKHPIRDRKAHDAAFEKNFDELRKWVDTTEREYVLLHVRRARRRGELGTALKLLNKYIKSGDSSYWLYKKKHDVLEDLDWDFQKEQAARRLLIRFPKDYAPF